MSGSLSPEIVATISKHAITGTIAVVIGVVLVVLGGLRMAAKAASAFVIPIAGLVVVVIGILLFTRTI